MKIYLKYLLAFFLGAFGLLTLFLSASVIFDLFGIRAKEGDYVLFVVWANFVSSILYLFSAYGFVKAIRWTTILLGISFVVLLSAFIGLLIHIYSGGIYETKTIWAMLFRTTVTLFLTRISYVVISNRKKIDQL